jgi:hypothetical protein
MRLTDKRLIATLICLFVLSQAVFSQTTATLPEIDRTRIAEAFRLGDKLAEKVWKNWDKTPFAVLLVTPDTEFLIRHPQPSKDFTEIGYDSLLKSKIYRRKRVFNQGFLATFPAVQGSSVSTIVVGQAENTWVKTSTPWVATLLHEHFHQFQDSHPGMYDELLALDLANGDTTGMWMLNYPFPYKNAKTGEDFGKLALQLAKTLETKNNKDFRSELKIYLKMRRDFNSSLRSNDYKYLSMQFWKEGIARYTEYRIARLAAGNYQPLAEFKKLKDYQPYAETAANMRKQIIDSLKAMQLAKLEREVAYSFGAGEAMLLDRAKIKWKPRYLSSKFYVDKYFENVK